MNEIHLASQGSTFFRSVIEVTALVLLTGCYVVALYFIYLAWQMPESYALLSIVAGFLLVGNYCLDSLHRSYGLVL